MSLQDQLAQLPYFAGLTGETLAALARAVREREVESGEQILIAGELSTPERNCIGGPEQKSVATASKKAPDIGGLLAFGGLSPGWRRRR
jgi:hypothetical protein